MLLTNCFVLRRHWRLYAFFPDLRTALTQSLPRVSSRPDRRASRGVSQYSATSVQRPVRLVAVRWLMAAETLRPKAADLAMLRHVVLNVLHLDKSIFGGISVKCKELTWDDGKLLGFMLKLAA